MAKVLPRGLSDVQLAAVAAALHFVVALLFVLAVMHLSLGPALMNSWSSSALSGHLVVILGGTLAAAACSRAIARDGIATAARSALRAYGAAAIFTAITRWACVIEREWHFLDGRGYPRAVFDEGMLFFVPQLALGVATASVFRALTMAARDPGRIPSEDRQGRTRALLAVACYLLVYAGPMTPFLVTILLRHRDLDLDRILLWVIPVIAGSVVAAFMAEGIARQPRLPLGIAFLSHALAALISFAITAGAAVLIDFRGSASSPMDYSYSLMRFAWFSGLSFIAYAIVQTALGTVSGALFWVVSRRLPTPSAPRSRPAAIGSEPPA